MPDQFQAPGPYPTVQVEEPNIEYAELLMSDMSSTISEATAISTYMYDHFVTLTETNLSYAFEQIALIENRHLDILGKLCAMLGGDPRLWEKTAMGMRYWSPSYLKYSTDIEVMLRYAVESEIAGIEKYRTHMDIIKDEYIKQNIARILEDEEIHLIVLNNLIESQKNSAT